MIRHIAEPRREPDRIRMTQEVLGVARCPLCHAALVARQGRRGPYFHCLCAPKASARCDPMPNEAPRSRSPSGRG